jgi:CHASE2 domain-containing sensor protein
MNKNTKIGFTLSILIGVVICALNLAGVINFGWWIYAAPIFTIAVFIIGTWVWYYMQVFWADFKRSFEKFYK